MGVSLRQWTGGHVYALCTELFLRTEKEAGKKTKGLKKKKNTNQPHNTASDLIINLNHMKSSRLLPDGSQTRAASVTVSTPH